MDGRAGDARRTIEAVAEPADEEDVGLPDVSFATSPDASFAMSPDASFAASPIERLLTGPTRRSSDAAPAVSAASAIPGVVRATIVGAHEDGRPLVTWPGAPDGQAAAEAVWMNDAPTWSDCTGLAAVIGFENGDPARPLLLGLLGKPRGATPACHTPDVVSDPASAKVSDPGRTPDAARSVRIESADELTLQCGEAKIVLRADGSVTILGGKVVTRARGVNKIKGGSVQIN